MKEETNNRMNEQPFGYGFVNKTEDEKLLTDINRSYIEKLQLFTKMLRRNKMFDNAQTKDQIDVIYLEKIKQLLKEQEDQKD